jgi:hypothetical protein
MSSKIRLFNFLRGVDFKNILFLAYRSAIWKSSFKGQKLQGIRGVSKERGEDSSATYGDGIDAISIHDSRTEDKEGISQVKFLSLMEVKIS